MSLFPLDTVRNASIDQDIEPVLEDIREEIIRCPAGDEDQVSSEDMLEVYDMARPRLNVLVGLLRDRRGRRGADISTGLGFLPVLLERYGVLVTATEHNMEISRFATSHGVEVRPYTIGIDAAPFERESLDFVVLGEVLEHLKLPAVRVLQEMADLLHPGGRFILTTPNIARFDHIEALIAGENFLEPFPEELPSGADATDYIEHVREYSVREIVEATEATGMVVDQVIMTGWGEDGYQPLTNPYANQICVLTAMK